MCVCAWVVYGCECVCGWRVCQEVVCVCVHGVCMWVGGWYMCVCVWVVSGCESVWVMSVSGVVCVCVWCV